MKKRYIGKIKFSVEELLSGLNGVDIDKLIERKKLLELNKDKLAIKGIEVSFESLEDNLKAIKNKEKAVIVRIDKKVEYERVIKVLDLLQKYSLTNLALVTNEENKK